MRIRLTEPETMGDLVAYLRRCGCTAEIAGQNTVEVAPPERPRVENAYLRMELDAYLRVWRAMHPGIAAELLWEPAPEEPDRRARPWRQAKVPS